MGRLFSIVFFFRSGLFLIAIQFCKPFGITKKLTEFTSNFVSEIPSPILVLAFSNVLEGRN